jgi:hypothetical protein
MLDFTPVREKQTTLSDLAAGVSPIDLRELTIEMVDNQLHRITDCTDADVIFVPDDPLADDPFADDPGDVDLAWTLGHVIVHVTASSEEAAAIAAELARGVKYHGASLEMWPIEPNLDNYYKSRPGAPQMNAISRFLYGLMHDDDHLEQITEIAQQAKWLEE